MKKNILVQIYKVEKARTNEKKNLLQDNFDFVVDKSNFVHTDGQGIDVKKFDAHTMNVMTSVHTNVDSIGLGPNICS